MAGVSDSCDQVVSESESFTDTDGKKYVTGDVFSSSEDSHHGDANPGRGCKRKIRKHSWKDEVRKRHRNQGKSYITRKGKTVAAKKFVLVRECCKSNCFSLFKQEEMLGCFNRFWAMPNKPQQDTHLQSFITKCDVATAAVKVKSKNRECSFKYWFRPSKQEVCRKFILNILQISEKRLRTVQNLIKTGAVASEKRGKHHNRPYKIDESAWKMIKEHWQSIPSKTSHYKGKKSSRKYFENPNLNVQMLFNLFKDYYFEKTQTVLKMQYSTYHRHFRENSEYSFRLPRTDV